MNIISKRQGDDDLPADTRLTAGLWCTGHYRWTGSVCHYTGRQIPDISGVLAVFAERRQDRHGPYALLRCVTLN